MKVIILCGGLGKRMEPLTLKYPKSLIPIKLRNSEMSILENNIRVLLNSGIEISEIVICASSDYFRRKDYIDIIDKLELGLYGNDLKISQVVNDDFEHNNYLSMKKSLSYLMSGQVVRENILTLEGDVILKDEFTNFLKSAIISCMTSYFCKYRNNEWVLYRDDCKDYYEYVECSSGLAMAGATYLRFDCLKELLKGLQSVKDKNTFWDEVLVHGKFIRNIIDSKDTIIECDTIKDLISNNLMTYKRISTLLSDDGKSVKMSSMTNTCYQIKWNNQSYILRIPGAGTDQFINRSRERQVSEYIIKSDIIPDFVIYNGDIKLTEFIKSRISCPGDCEEVVHLMEKYHKIKVPRTKEMITNLIEELDDYEKLYDVNSTKLVRTYYKIKEIYRKYIQKYQHENLVLCHRDFDPRNILFDENEKGYLIDTEYSGLLNKYWDYGCYVAEYRLFFKEEYDEDSFIDNLVKFSEDELSKWEIKLWSGIVDFVWSCWSIAKISLCEDYNEYLQERWYNACSVLKSLNII